MSEKISNNSLKLNCEQPHWVKAPSLDTSIKLAGEEAKDRLYEPKHKKKLVRVLTVVAYVFFVSLAAIMLSLYYVFLWKGYPKEIKNTTVTESPLCRDKPGTIYYYICIYQFSGMLKYFYFLEFLINVLAS